MPTLTGMTAVGNDLDRSAARRTPFRLAGRMLRERASGWWFTSQVLSTSGAAAQTVAQSWLVYRLTGRAIDLGVLGAVAWLPVLFGASWAGGVVDRVGGRRVLIATQVLFTVVCSVQVVLIATDRINVGLVLLLAAVTGAVSAFDLPARQVYMLELVGPDRLASAVGLNEVVYNASRVLGPAVGGALLVTVGVAACFAVNAMSFLPVLVVLARYAPPGVHAARGATARYADGWRQVWASPIIWSGLLVAVAAAMLFNLGIAVPLLASQVFHLGGGGYGAMMAAFGLGALPGAIVAASGWAVPTGPRVRALTAATGFTVLATALAPAVALASAGIALAGFLSIWLIAMVSTLVQLEAAPAVRGRVMGIWTMALPGTIPFTGMVTAAVAQAGGARLGYGLSGVVLVVVAGVTWRALRASR
jgi:MFS family permease